MSTPQTFDVVVVGGGPGGYVAAIRAAQLGFKTAVIEKAEMGGICLNWGCIPTKALLKNAEIYEIINHRRAEFGLKIDQVEVDFGKVIKRSRNVANRLSKGISFLMKKNKITVIAGTAAFSGKNQLSVTNGKDNETVQVTAKHIIIATGARPKTIPGVEINGKTIITSREAMTLPEIPKSMIVLGAGAIGIEFAYMYHCFGTKITVVEMMPHILPVEDEEISRTLEKIYKKKKMNILTETRVESCHATADGVEVTVTDKKGKTQTLTSDMALMAIGVTGNVENIGLDEIGVHYERGAIAVDEYYRTNVEGIYAIGDVIGAPWLAHVASHEGLICVEHIAGLNPHPLDYGSIPGCTYCQPQVASIGLTEAKAKAAGYDVKIGKFPFTASGKALAIGESEGFVKVIYDAKYGELLGAHIIGAEATEMIAEMGLAKSLEATENEILHTIHAHPTLSEAIMEATGDALGQAIHI
ncbi:MAG: dihydrolipoyl dehydrogenase [Gemmatimonadetes bacterium]|nr:MAG: dihydrolipoyl dehydrogenase [Gemmatimonadota bacterium]